MRGLLALLASYAIKKSQDNLTPIPSHFRTGPDARFVSEAFDNMNMKGTKTTVCCTLAVFQDADDTLTQKPDVNDKKISTRLTETLPCQELTPWFKSKDRTSLPTDMKIISQTDKIELSSQSRKQFIINSGRCAIAENRDEAYYTWAAANALITNRCSPMKKVGFLPVVPRSVTNYSTVYSALQSFEDMKKQLSQQIFPVIPDEGVCQVIMDIVLSHPSKFPNLFPMMGIFHMAKVTLHCVGKYFKGSGIDIALILAKCFRSNTIKSVLSGGHYVRSFLGTEIIKEGFEIWSGKHSRQNTLRMNGWYV